MDKSSIYDFISDDELVMDKSEVLKAGRRMVVNSKDNKVDDEQKVVTNMKQQGSGLKSYRIRISKVHL